MTLRKLLNILNEYKIIDSVNLSSKDIIEVMASDNSLVFDSEDSYNLELEITFLEFFEVLIGCAARLNENQEASKTRASRKSVTPAASASLPVQSTDAISDANNQDQNPTANVNNLLGIVLY
jgi:hypothetical protein